MDGFLQRLARLHKAGHKPIEVGAEVAGIHQQHLVALVYQHDNGNGQLGPHLFATLGTLLRDVRVHAHGGSADAAIAGVLVPVEQLMTLSRLQVVVL